MRTWTEQMGLPVINVRRTSPTTFELTQKRFFSNIKDYDSTYDDSEFKFVYLNIPFAIIFFFLNTIYFFLSYTWTIPLTYFFDNDANVRRKWFNFDDVSVPISAPIETKWLKFNSHQVGYYRVNYEDDMWHEIVKDLILTPDKFAVADRAHLLNDVFALADANQVNYDIALDMTKYLNQESHFVPWYVAATKLQALQGNLIFTDSYLDFLQYARSLINKVYQEVTWTVDEENHLRK